MIWPFNRLAAWWEWRRLERRITVVASAEYQTTFIGRDGTENGLTALHIVAFCITGNGRRFSDVSSSDLQASQAHDSVVRARAFWRIHGDLPDSARRVVQKGGANLIVIDGGAA